MAEGKKSFVLYADYIHTIQHLTDEQAGKLLKHLMQYVNDQNPETDDPITKLAFEPIKQQLKRDLKHWELIKEKRSAAGKASAEKRKQKATNSTSVKSVKQTSTNSTVNDNVNVNVNEINYKDYLFSLNEITGKKYRAITDKTKGQISARTKEGYTLRDFTKAITNAFNDEFHKNNSHKYLTLEYISRADQLDKWLNTEVKKQRATGQFRDHLC